MCHGKTEIVPDRDGSDPYQVGCPGLGCLWEVGAIILAGIGLPWVEGHLVSLWSRDFSSPTSLPIEAFRSPKEEVSSVRLTVAVTSPQT